MRCVALGLLLAACSSTTAGRDGVGTSASEAATPTSSSGGASSGGGTSVTGMESDSVGGNSTAVNTTGPGGAGGVSSTTTGGAGGGASQAAVATTALGGQAGTAGGMTTGSGGGGNIAPQGSYCRSFYNSSGGANPCYIGSDGQAHCIVNDGSTVTLSEVPGSVVSVASWDYTTRACAVNDAGAVYCGDYGSLSLWVSGGATQVSGLANGQCAIVEGSVQCESVSVPSSVDTGTGRVTLLGCYSDGCCAATDEPKLYCWGDTSENFGVDSAEPFDVPLPSGKQVLQIGAGQVHVCALLEGGQVHCWGQDWNGQLGGLGANMADGVAVVEQGAIGVASGQFHMCAALADGTVQCAGLAGVHGAGQNSSTLSEVPGISSAVAVTAGRYASCALLADASVKCWGDYGDLPAGENETTDPIDVMGVSVAPCE